MYHYEYQLVDKYKYQHFNHYALVGGSGDGERREDAIVVRIQRDERHEDIDGMRRQRVVAGAGLAVKPSQRPQKGRPAPSYGASNTAGAPTKPRLAAGARAT